MGRHLDVLVVGGGASALLTANYLSRKGLRGLIIDQGELDDIDPWNFADWSISANSAPNFHKILDQLAMKDEFRLKATVVSPSLRIVTPNKRVELDEDTNISKKLSEILDVPFEEIKRSIEYFKDISTQVQQVTSKAPFPPDSFWGRRSLHGQIQGLSALQKPLAEIVPKLPQNLMHFVAGLLPYFTHLRKPTDLNQLTVAQVAPLLPVLASGFKQVGGQQAVRSLLLQRAKRFGFEVSEGSIKELVFEGGRFRATSTSSNESNLFDLLIDGSRFNVTLDFLPEKIQTSLSKNMAAEFKPVHKLIRNQWSIKSEVLPPGMGRSVMLLDDRFDLKGWLTVESASATSKRTILSLKTTEADLEEATKNLKALIPFWSEGNPTAVPDKAPPKPLFETDLSINLGLGTQTVKSGQKRFVLASPNILPALPILEASSIIARDAAAAASKILGDKRQA